jgi:hypothetical protein
LDGGPTNWNQGEVIGESGYQRGSFLVACNGMLKDHINLQDQSYGEKLGVGPRRVRGGRSGRGERSIFSSDPRSCLDLMNETFVGG